MKKTIWLALYRQRQERGMSITYGEYHIGCLVYGSKEDCELVAKRDSFVKAVPVQFNTETGEVYAD